ncbi:DoxX family membrane protein [Myceligenerans pegani]|uniref:DoxX family membrane protein n=1 Tax=Myceligenerans pegani TaxID=2776917 RepID=A0ABR9N138_9MICO|nr:DoxX family membrane protein [Myceligenerans sp. TRM 65318]MBE1877365.1 DoxX family membrane protein [Myceligenerans sp. TRM 65318]MBE3019636.1 DoxX family membrane protein [Myceligenerans sp. TRM 65318]
MVLRHIARPLLASWFVASGVQAARKPAEHVQAAKRGSGLVTKALGAEPLSEKQVTTVIRAHGIALAAAGGLLALGKAPRTAAVTLALLTVPLAVVNQPFGSSDGDREARAQRFVGNLGAIGAALIAGADTEGRPSIGWRVQQARAARAAARAAKASAKES